MKIRNISMKVISLFLATILLSSNVAIAANWEVLATGFAGCQTKGYSTHDWQNYYTSSYWNAYSGHNCTNYAAYMAILNGAATPIYGNACYWAIRAKSAGYTVDNKPAVGAIAQWDANSVTYVGSAGHVAYVEEVGSNYIIVSEDNYGGDFRWRKVYSDLWPSNFIHINETQSGQSGAQTATSPTVTANNASSVTSTGVYLSGAVTNPSRLTITEVGVELGASQDNLQKAGYDKVNYTYSSFNMWYDQSELNVTLSPGATYYYRLYAISGGTPYYSAVMSFSTVDASSPTSSESTWDGTSISQPKLEGSIYQITCGAELAWIAQQTNTGANSFNGYIVKLMNDIDLNNENWVPIGYKTASPFMGDFNGNEKTISNLYINANYENCALIGCLTAGNVQNLIVNGASITNTNTSGTTAVLVANNCGITQNCTISGDKIIVTGHGSTGTLAGVLPGPKNMSTQDSRVLDCTINSNVIITAQKSSGGIVGNTYSGIVSGVTVNGNIEVVNGSYTEGFIGGYIGGLVGYIGGGTSVTNNTINGNIYVSGGGEYVGGLGGAQYYGNNKLQNNVVNGNVTVVSSYDNVGGIIGKNFHGSVSNNTVSGTTTVNGVTQ